MVIPVLVDGAQLPKVSDLPESINALPLYNAFTLRHENFGRDFQELSFHVSRLVGSRSRRLVQLAAALAVCIALMGGTYFTLERLDYLEKWRAFQAKAEAHRVAEYQRTQAAIKDPAIGLEILAETRFRDCLECPEMAVIPAGKFLMGAPEDEESSKNNERPQRVVVFRRPFAIGRYEVTFEQWERCASEGGCNTYYPSDQKWGRGKRPVIYVSWFDAKAYVVWLSQKTGKNYRLPTEAEWEYSARAGTATTFNTGSKISTSEANFDGRYAYSTSDIGVYRSQTIEVGQFPVNGFGLHDVHGNVAEWVEDCIYENYSGAPVDGTARVGNANTSRTCARVTRGGSWNSASIYVRSALSSGALPNHRSYFIGFRIARAVE